MKAVTALCIEFSMMAGVESDENRKIMVFG